MRVVLATDGSASAAVAAELVGAIRWPVGTWIDAIRVVVDDGRDAAIGPWPVVAFPHPRGSQEALQAAEDALVGTVETLSKLGLKTGHAVLRGYAPDALLGWIECHRPDLVIVGNRGVSGLERTLLGSVSEALVDESPVPVLVARKPALEQVVVAVDGSEIAAEAVATIQRWPFLAMTEIRALSVADPSAPRSPRDVLPGDTPNPRGEHALSVDQMTAIAGAAAARLRAVGFDARSEVRTGTPATAIVGFASDWQADLVILGSRGRTGLTRMLLGSVARSVLHHAPCSVLVVRRHGDPLRGLRSETPVGAWAVRPGS